MECQTKFVSFDFFFLVVFRGRVDKVSKEGKFPRALISIVPIRIRREICHEGLFNDDSLRGE